jgi:membrane-associated protease RseP (regulator of RpoE activity)
VLINADTIPSKLLIDTGNSDAIWLFPARKAEIVVPQKNFHDFLGRGFNGEIFGRKGRIKEFALGKFKFENPIVAFPDSASYRNLKMAESRLGSIGGELLKRFVIIFNYKERSFHVKKNAHFNLPFFYNMTGIELHHDGLKLVHEEYRNNDLKKGVTIHYGEVQHDLKYRFELKPAYKIASVRPDSPAAKSGLQKNDKLISINGILAHRHSLPELNEMLRQKPGTILKLAIERNEEPLEVELQLEDLL